MGSSKTPIVNWFWGAEHLWLEIGFRGMFIFHAFVPPIFPDIPKLEARVVMDGMKVRIYCKNDALMSYIKELIVNAQTLMKET